MRPDVLDLRDFYASPLGRMAVRLLGRHINRLWPPDANLRVLAIGYGLPYLDPDPKRWERAIAFMPDRQGAVTWPESGGNRTLLGDEMALPFPDAMFDRVLLVHGLEFVDHVGALLQEVWRVLAPQGQLMLLTPNRAGSWARFERTPFGNGRPFSKGQLSALLDEAMLSPSDWLHALYAPPFERQFWISALPGMERVGRALLPKLGGVHIVRAQKVVYAGRHKKQRGVVRRLRPAPAFGGAPVPNMRAPRTPG